MAGDKIVLELDLTEAEIIRNAIRSSIPPEGVHQMILWALYARLNKRIEEFVLKNET